LAEIRVALASAIPLSITAVLVVLLRYANGLILNAYLGTLALGVFYAAFRLVELASIVPNLVSSVFLPRLSFQVANHRERAHAQARLYAQFQMVGGFFLSAMFFAEAPSIIQIIYGAQYVGAVELLRVMSIAVLFTFAIVSYTNCLIAFRQDWAMVRILVVSCIVGIGSGFALVPLIGSIGAALAFSLINFSGWLVSLPIYRQVIGSLQLGVWKMPAVGSLMLILTAIISQRLGIPLWLRLPFELIAYAFINREIITTLRLSRQEWTV
jgi:O-antigen/teichoic acid export membrane protein